MNKNLCISIDISQLSHHARAVAPAHIVGGPAEDFGKVVAAFHGRVMPDRVLVHLNVPADLFGLQTAHGTSVFASGVAALEFARPHLAGKGVNAADLQKLTVDSIQIESVSVPFILEMGYMQDAAKLRKQIMHRALALGLQCDLYSDQSWVTYKHADAKPSGALRGACVDGSKAMLGHTTKVAVQRAPLSSRVFLEVGLTATVLGAKGWSSLESWRDAYTVGRYKEIFNTHVRALFELDSTRQLSRPDEEVMKRLGAQARSALKDYFKGSELKEATLAPVRRLGAPAHSGRARLIRAICADVQDTTGIDLMVKWAKFQTATPTFLKEKLQYQGDFGGSLPVRHGPFSIPDSAAGVATFCKANWPQLLAGLKRNGDAAGPARAIGL